MSSSHLLALIVAVAVVTYSCPAAAQTLPAIRISVSGNATETLFVSAMNSLNSKYSGKTISVYPGTLHVDQDKYSIDIQNVQADQIGIPTDSNHDIFSFTDHKTSVMPGSLYFGLLGTRAEFFASYHLRGDDWPHVEDWGRIWFSFPSSSLVAAVTFGVDGTGRLTSQAHSDFTVQGDVSVGVSGGDAWDSLVNTILNTNKPKIAGAISSAIGPKVAGAITSAVSKIPTSITIAATTKYEIVLTTAHVANPVSEVDNSMSLFLDGRMSPDGHEVCPFNTTVALPHHQLSTSGRFAEIAISDNMAKCALWSLWHKNAFSAVINAAQLPSVVPYKLETNCTAWAPIAPGLSTTFPNMPMIMSIHPNAAPSIQFSPTTDITIVTDIDLDYAVVVDVSNVKGAFSIILHVEADVCVTEGTAPDAGHIMFIPQLTRLVLSFSAGHSEVGAVDVSSLNTLLKAFLPLALKEINIALAKKGIKIPITGKHATAHNVSLSFVNDAAIVSLDVALNLAAVTEEDFSIEQPVEQVIKEIGSFIVSLVQSSAQK